MGWSGQGYFGGENSWSVDSGNGDRNSRIEEFDSKPVTIPNLNFLAYGCSSSTYFRGSFDAIMTYDEVNEALKPLNGYLVYASKYGGTEQFESSEMWVKVVGQTTYFCHYSEANGRDANGNGYFTEDDMFRIFHIVAEITELNTKELFLPNWCHPELLCVYGKLRYAYEAWQRGEFFLWTTPEGKTLYYAAYRNTDYANANGIRYRAYKQLGLKTIEGEEVSENKPLILATAKFIESGLRYTRGDGTSTYSWTHTKGKAGGYGNDTHIILRWNEEKNLLLEVIFDMAQYFPLVIRWETTLTDADQVYVSKSQQSWFVAQNLQADGTFKVSGTSPIITQFPKGLGTSVTNVYIGSELIETITLPYERYEYYYEEDEE
jgi:hypothetical protein